MKKIVIALFILSQNVFALEALELKKGDILLQPLHCWSCSLIEAQTKSIYSHIGVVIDVDKKNVQVAEAFMSVRKVSLLEFLKKTQKGQKVKVIRPSWVSKNIDEFFNENYLGNDYDSNFLWNNFKENKELLYCSELVYKLFHHLNIKTPAPAIMKFDVNPELWRKFFKGKTPVGKIGISPAAFDDEYLYEHIGYL